MGTRYKQFVRLLDNWPLDLDKQGRDLAVYLRERVGHAFRQGEATRISNPQECDRTLKALNGISSNMYRDMYPRLRKGTANGMATEQLRQITSTEWINIFRKDDGLPELEPIDRQKAQEHDKEDSEKSV